MSTSAGTTAVPLAPSTTAAAAGARPMVLVAGAAAALGAGLSGASVAVNGALRDYPTLSGQAVRYAVGALTLLLWARVRRLPLPRPSRRDLLQLTLLAATGLAGFNIFVLAALDHAEPAAIGVIVGGVPIVLAVVGPLVRGSRPAGTTVAAAVVVTCGAAVVQGGGRLSLAGVLLAGGALACEVAFTVLALPVMPRLGPLGVSIEACAVAAGLLAVAAPLVHGRDALTAPTGSQAAAIVVLGTVVTAVAFVAWYSSVDAVGPVRTGLFAGLAPVGTLVTAMAMDGHAPHLAEALGTLIVAAGITLGVRTAARAPAGAAA
jgi:drug/metabolite transporter (DMT)-like permease